VVSRDSEWSGKLIVFGLILALIGMVLLLIVGLMFAVYPSNYDNDIDTMRNMVYAGVILIVIGAGISVVLYVHQ
jgi:glucose uptake protein GlcU